LGYFILNKFKASLSPSNITTDDNILKATNMFVIYKLALEMVRHCFITFVVTMLRVVKYNVKN
jgi:hypothetical protein